eukprot:403350341
MSEEEVENVEVENQEEQVPPEPKNILKPEQIAAGLSQVSKIHDGSSYAYVNLNLEEKELEELGDHLRLYQHLRFLNLSKNQLKDINEITYLPYLLTLNASENQIQDIGFFESNTEALQFTQLVNLSKNKIQTLISMIQPRMTRLILNENEIASAMNFQCGSKLKILELRKNKLTDCKGLGNLYMLEELYLAENEITTIEDLVNMTNLTKLHLRGNKLTTLENQIAISNSYLKYINLRDNQIADLKGIQNLCSLSLLETFGMQGNPIVEEKGDGFKTDFLIQTNEWIKIKKLNKEEVTAEDHENANNERETRKKEEEEARLEKERLALEKNDEEEVQPAEDE